MNAKDYAEFNFMNAQKIYDNRLDEMQCEHDEWKRRAKNQARRKNKNKPKKITDSDALDAMFGVPLEIK